jgi:Zn-dependent M16 (insulinase) family peptidase
MFYRTYIDTAYTAIIGKPSLSMSKDLIEDERQRIESQRAILGEEGLTILGAKLNHANRMNEAQIPSRIMEGFPIPSVSSISSIEVLTAVNPYYQHTTTIPKNLVQAHVNRDGHVKDIPYFIQYDRKVFF